jgi:undecaprenyl-diphosphatase
VHLNATPPARPDSAPAPDAKTGAIGIAAILGGLATALGSVSLFAWLADEMLEGSTRAFDDAVRGALHAISSPGLTHAFRLITTLGSPVVLALLGVAAAGFFAWRRWWRGAVLLVVSMAGAGLLDLALKLTFHRKRPSAFFDYPLPRSYSFPSGHALFSLCFFATVAGLLSPRLPRQGVQRPLVWTVAALCVLLIGTSRVYLGVHYPSDVVAGYIAGLVWVAIVRTIDRVLHRRAAMRGGA